jgi:hypothetical protein
VLCFARSWYGSGKRKRSTCNQHHCHKDLDHVFYSFDVWGELLLYRKKQHPLHIPPIYRINRKVPFALHLLEEKGVILAGGLPLGERMLVFIIEASSKEEADRILRELPCWEVFDWEVRPILTFGNRATEGQSIVSKLRKSRK